MRRAPARRSRRCRVAALAAVLVAVATLAGCSSHATLPEAALATYLPAGSQVVVDVDVDEVRSALDLPPTADGRTDAGSPSAASDASQRLADAISLGLALGRYAGIDPTAALGLDLSGLHELASAFTLDRSLVVLLRTSQPWAELEHTLLAKGFTAAAGALSGTATVPLTVSHDDDRVVIATDPVAAAAADATHAHGADDPVSLLARVTGPIRIARLGHLPASTSPLAAASGTTTTTTTVPSQRSCTGAWAMGEDPATRTGELAVRTRARWKPPARLGDFTFANDASHDGVATVHYEFTAAPPALATVTELTTSPFSPTSFAVCNPLP